MDTKENNQRDFKGIWIPKEIWLNKDLNITDKIFLVEIDSLDGEKGCYASNDYFADFFDLSKNRCSEIINKLSKKGYINIKKINPTELKEKVIQNKNKGITCEWCGCKTEAIQQHHYPIPKCEGGTETVSICPNCHYEYHNLQRKIYTVNNQKIKGVEK